MFVYSSILLECHFKNVLVRNVTFSWPPVLLLATFSSIAHPNDFSSDTVVLWPLSNTLARCEVDRMNGGPANQRTVKRTERPSVVVRSSVHHWFIMFCLITYFTVAASLFTWCPVYTSIFIAKKQNIQNKANKWHIHLLTPLYWHKRLVHRFKPLQG